MTNGELNAELNSEFNSQFEIRHSTFRQLPSRITRQESMSKLTSPMVRRV